MNNNWIQCAQKHFLALIIVCFAHVISIAFTKEVVKPFQEDYFPEIAAFAALFFLPHGVRVLAAWYFGWRSIIYLFLANCFSSILFYGDEAWTLHLFTVYLAVSSVGFVTFELFRISGWNLYAQAGAHPLESWKQIVLIGIFSSILNSLALNLIYANEILPENAFGTMFSYMIGDSTGALALLLLLALVWGVKLMPDGKQIN